MIDIFQASAKLGLQVTWTRNIDLKRSACGVWQISKGHIETLKQNKVNVAFLTFSMQDHLIFHVVRTVIGIALFIAQSLGKLEKYNWRLYALL